MKRLLFVFAAVLAIRGAAVAQNDANKREFFRLDFVLKESEGGKMVNTRSFQMMAVTNENATSSIRSGDKIPVPSVGTGGTTIYIDVGVNLDVRRLHRTGDELELDITAEASNADTSNIIRQTRWNSLVTIPIRKPVVIFSSEGPSAKRQLQLEITATPIH